MCYYNDFMKKRILLLLTFIITISLFNNGTTSAEGPKNYLKGKFYSSVKDHFLIATEKMKDNRFEKTVVAMLENDKDGAWGLVVNKPIGPIPLALLVDPSLSTSEEREELYKVNILIFWGGPVEEKEIFVLHSTEYQNENTKNYGNISISQDYNILLDIAENKGPEKSLVILGYSGWGSGQLEGEMERDHWVLSDINLDIAFDDESNTKWNKAHKNSFLKIHIFDLVMTFCLHHILHTPFLQSQVLRKDSHNLIIWRHFLVLPDASTFLHSLHVLKLLFYLKLEL